MNTLYWHDYETTGTDPRYDRACQFAGVRTDEDLNIIGEPLMIYCRPSGDSLPHPQAALITGISPQLTQKEGLCEAEFIRKIHDELAAPGTCGVGYNSLRFDDEFTRFTLFRNFYDAYAREWQNDNSRWDIIDMVRLTRALRPEGINWPDNDNGKPSFRLEHLTAANGIEHQGAHDALVDVYATIALAKLIKTQQPRLYDFVYQHRRKQAIGPLLNVRERKPVIHVSRMYPSDYCGTALVVPVAADPNNANAVVVYDLRHNPSALIHEDVETLKQRLFTPAAELADGEQRPALKTIHINKCPLIVPESTLDDAAAARLSIDRQQHYEHLAMLNAAGDLSVKINQIFAGQQFEPIEDTDASLYSGGFFSNNDRNKMQIIREATPEQLASLSIPFEDKRLAEMLFRYRARNWPESLSADEASQWHDYCQQRLLHNDNPAILDLAGFDQALAEAEQNATAEQAELLSDLKAYRDELASALAEKSAI
jgi:exodeoxyribonuclease-1